LHRFFDGSTKSQFKIDGVFHWTLGTFDYYGITGKLGEGNGTWSIDEVISEANDRHNEMVISGGGGDVGSRTPEPEPSNMVEDAEWKGTFGGDNVISHI
jgi:hypothetical protein